MEQWILFLGRFHPLFVHLPIGIMVALVVIESLNPIRKKGATDILLGLALIGALLSAVTGLMLEQEGGYSEDRIFLHKVLGISMTIALLITVYVRVKFRAKRGAYLLLLGLSTILMALGSHQGGIMTHGRHFITEHFPFNQNPDNNAESASTTAVPDDGTISYTLHIKPIMEAICNECHNADKMKADLRTDSYEAIMKGSKFGPVVTPGDPDDSAFYYLTTFPEDDPDRMPKDDDPLTVEQIQIIEDWIAQGATGD